MVYFAVIFGFALFLDYIFGIGNEEGSFMVAFLPLTLGVLFCFAFDDCYLYYRILSIIAIVIYIVMLISTFYKNRQILKEAIANKKEKKHVENKNIKVFFRPAIVYFCFFAIITLMALVIG